MSDIISSIKLLAPENFSKKSIFEKLKLDKANGLPEDSKKVLAVSPATPGTASGTHLQNIVVLKKRYHEIHEIENS